MITLIYACICTNWCIFFVAEDRVRAIEERLFKRAKEAAMSAIPEEVRTLRDKAYKKAKDRTAFA